MNFSSLDDKAVIEKAMQSATGEKFKRLLSGDIAGYPSQSEADQAFCNMLAFWAQGNFSQIDRIFRGSGLYRKKWDRKQSGTTYGAITINKAIKNLWQSIQAEGTETKGAETNGTEKRFWFLS